MSAALHKWGEWIRWGSTIAVIIAFAVFDNRYVRQSAYEKDRTVENSRAEALSHSMAAVKTSLALLESQSKIIHDHEDRLRRLELSGLKHASLFSP